MKTKKTTKTIKKKKENIKDIDIASSIKDSFLQYSVAATVRSVPSIIDGLKPSQRRVLYALYKELNPKEFVKSARAVGEIMGKYHPHGDQSIYATLVNMAQTDRHNNPYIESQGNFGSILSSLNDAAAPRYTELRLSKFAEMVFFQDYYTELEYTETYDNKTKEPKVLLPLVPMILVKGTDGIAVGYTSTVPPHDYKSVCNAYIYYIKNRDRLKDTDWDTIASMIKVKFPNNPEISGDTIKGLLTGQGKIYMKAKYKFTKQKIKRSDMTVLRITELPYLVSPVTFIEKLQTVKGYKEYIYGVNDMSSRGEIIVDLILTKETNRNKILEFLKTAKCGFTTEMNYTMNLIGLDNVLKRMGIRDIFNSHYNYLIKILSKYLENLRDKYDDDLIFYEVLYVIVRDKERAKKFMEDVTNYSRLKLYKIFYKDYAIESHIVDRILNSNISILSKDSFVKDKIKETKNKLKDINKNLNNIESYIIYMIEETLSNTKLKESE